MQNNFLFFFQALIICNNYIFTNAIIGHAVRNATRDEYPAVVCLVYLNPNLSLRENMFCTGIFVTLSHIVSSTHCFDNVGETNFKLIAEHPNLLEGTEYFPCWWTTYETWAQIGNIPTPFLDNDIAMLRINGEASSRVRPSPITVISPQSLLFGMEAQTAGFGRTTNYPYAETLRTANVQILTTEQCEAQIYHSTGEYVQIHYRYLCSATYPPALLSEGDSGGPLYFQGFLVGLNRASCSNKLPKDHPKRLNIHLGLEFYRNFINEHKNF